MAQQPLNLADAIMQMKQNNSQLRVQQKEVDLSNAELEGTKSGFLPKVSLSHTAFFTNDPLNAFGFKLQQQAVTMEDFNPALLNNPDDMTHFNSKLAVQQPILNFDVYAARRALKEKIKANQFQKQFAEDMLVVEIQKAYSNLQFLYEAKQAVEKGQAAYQEVLRNTKNMEQQGYAKASDVLMVQVGLSEIQNKGIDIDNNISNLSDYLNWLMGKPSKEIYIPTETLVKKSLPNDQQVFSQDRADIKAMRSGLEAQWQMVDMNKKKLLPRINAFGEYNFNDKNIIGFGSNAYLAGISLSWDLFNGNETNNKIKQSKISYAKSESELQVYVEKNELELQKAKRDLTANQAKITLSETAHQQADESLRILENRYGQGLEKTADLLVAQAKTIEKQVALLEAIKDYNLSIIQINFLTQRSN
ncbi:TolC family protein [Sphingobacterium lactis]|uniref:TolC family protein n=1 Tax=Sphingobacterium lactis TaxID=797291 RepID=UPI003F81AFB5